MRSDENKRFHNKHIASTTEKYNYTVISLHHCTMSCGKIPHEAYFSAWQVFYRWIGCCSLCVWWRSVAVRSQAWQELSWFSCSSRVAGFLNYLPVDYGLHAAGFGILHLHPAVQAFLSSYKKRKKITTDMFIYRYHGSKEVSQCLRGEFCVLK